MQIWVDADACPGVIRDILFRAAERAGVAMTLVANQPVRIPPSRHVRFLRVASGFDVADNEIVRRLHPGDLVVTSDIPLAAEVVARGGHALSPRGELYSTENIGACLSMRDFMHNLRGCGIDTGGPPAMRPRDRQDFANNLERFLAGHMPGGRAPAE